MNSKCVICDIINAKIPSHIIYEDETFISFLDIKPLFLGHSLLASKKHIQTIYDLPASEGTALLQTIQHLGNAITQAMGAQGTFIAINNKVSQSIDHLHIHLVPRTKGDGLKGFFWPRTTYNNEAHMLEVKLAIQNQLSVAATVPEKK